MKKSIRIIALVLCVLMAGTVLAGCGKENKYVRAGVLNSTDAMSLYLIGAAKSTSYITTKEYKLFKKTVETEKRRSFQEVSNYVLFAEDAAASLARLRQEKQGIDIAYIPAADLKLITADDALRVVFIDCYETSGSVRGVWVASEAWLREAPNYSQKYLNGMVRCLDYRADHMNTSYAEEYSAYKAESDAKKGLVDYDFTKIGETMALCAIFSVCNNETMETPEFLAYNAATTYMMYQDFASGIGAGFNLCKEMYETSGCRKPFEELFDLSLMNNALQKYLEED